MSQVLHQYTFPIYIGIIIYSYIFGCIQLYAFFYFKRLDRLLIIQKRYPELVIAEVLMLLFGMFVGMPLDRNKQMHAISLPTAITYIAIVVASYIPHFIVDLEACRIWLLYFDLNYLHSSKNQLWKSQIDTSFALKDWYIQHRTKWGNQRYVTRLTLIYYLIIGTIVLITHLLIQIIDPSYLWLYHIVNALCYILPMGTVCYVYITCPQQLEDEFLFHYELKRTAIIYFVSFTLYTVAIGFEFAGFLILSHSMTAILVVPCLCLPALLSTLWIPHRINRMTAWSRMPSRDDSMDKSLDKSVSGDPPKSDSPKTAQKISTKQIMDRLRTTLGDEEKFEAFIHWMYREFSSEVILSFVEFVQFKQCIKEEIAAIGGTVNQTENDRFDYSFYDKMPRSTIVYGQIEANEKGNGVEIVYTEDVDPMGNVVDMDKVFEKIATAKLLRCKERAHLLFLKYVVHFAEFEINISGPTRNRYWGLDRSQYEGLDMQNMVSLFDELIAEMMKYIKV